MSIDARVKRVIRHDDGSGELQLIDRPARPGDTPGIAGQSVLRFATSPDSVRVLEGFNIWGGSGFLMLGEIEIARRVGYVRIVFHDDEVLGGAILGEIRRGRRRVVS